MKYGVVIPVYNEEKYLYHTLNSLVKQTVFPQVCIIVNDESTDNSFAIAKEFSENYSFIKLINSNTTYKGHEPGPKIINAFYKGFDLLNLDNLDFIVKLDADLTLPKDYFEEVIKLFKIDENIGIAGGVCYIKKESGEWQYENVSKKTHVRGPIKSYRKECFLKIKGIRKIRGWDTLDELLAMYYGYTIKVNPNLIVKHHRPTGKKNKYKVFIHAGENFYNFRYGIIISFLACAKIGLTRKPIILSGLLAAFGYISKIFGNTKHYVTLEEGEFIRKSIRSSIHKK